MKKIYALGSFLILAALATAQTPPPLEVTLSAPVEVQRTITEQTDTATVEWLLLTPGAAEIRVKVQPQNIEVKLSGADYAALVSVIESKVREGKTMRVAFAEALKPHIDDATAN